jgi:hypothetical protein
MVDFVEIDVERLADRQRRGGERLVLGDGTSPVLLLLVLLFDRVDQCCKCGVNLE